MRNALGSIDLTSVGEYITHTVVRMKRRMNEKDGAM
jgi:RecB family endonuclease NucS